MLKHNLFLLLTLFFSTMISQKSFAGFPDDFSDVTWIDPNISSWAQTSTISVDVTGTLLRVNDTKANVWPQRFHTILQSSCCNRSLWIFVKFEGQWYATTFEYMRFGQTVKAAEAVNGQQMKRSPFFGTGVRWEPAEGEVYGFMTSGMARFDLNNVNVRERSNVALYRWGVGPTTNANFTEVPRGPDGHPIEEGDDPTEDEPETCVEPEAPPVVNNSHNYTGTAVGNLVVTGTVNDTAEYTESISVVVKDDRSLRFTVADEVFETTVAQDGSYSGIFNLDILGQCNVSIGVNGSINGTTTSGTAQGSDSCLGAQATLNVTYSATSATEPSFIDLRPSQPKPRSVCDPQPIVTPIITILLDD